MISDDAAATTAVALATGSYQDLVQFLLKGQRATASTSSAHHRHVDTFHLSQMVSVHQSLLELCGGEHDHATTLEKHVMDATWSETENNNNRLGPDSLLMNTKPLSDTVQQLWNHRPDIATTCLAVLQDQSDDTHDQQVLDRKRLWVIQFLLHEVLLVVH
jgi:hypothetical protein